MKFSFDQSVGFPAESVPSRRRHRRGSASAIRRAVAESLEGRTFLSASLIPTADADVETQTADANFANANFGADTQLRINGDANDTIESLLTFDISGVTSVGSASLDMLGGADPNGPLVTNTVSIFAASAGFVEGNG